MTAPTTDSRVIYDGGYPNAHCADCGSKLRAAPARFDGEPTYVGYFPCPCNEARRDDLEREEWRPQCRKKVYCAVGRHDVFARNASSLKIGDVVVQCCTECATDVHSVTL